AAPPLPGGVTARRRRPGLLVCGFVSGSGQPLTRRYVPEPAHRAHLRRLHLLDRRRLLPYLLPAPHAAGGVPTLGRPRRRPQFLEVQDKVGQTSGPGEVGPVAGKGGTHVPMLGPRVRSALTLYQSQSD
ncbi:unnamed protein product, partial [Gulo gulo]